MEEIRNKQNDVMSEKDGVDDMSMKDGEKEVEEVVSNTNEVDVITPGQSLEPGTSCNLKRCR